MARTEPTYRLDHLAIAAETLAEGVAWAEARLGCALAGGGAHAAMGTHNRLLSLGPDLYLEVIAIDPEAPRPPHPRWFGLDRFTGPPRLHAWVVSVDDIAHAPAAAGRPLALARGDLRWQMAVPEAGALPFDGVHPAVIAWEGAGHPAPRLADQGLRLTSLTVSHPEAATLQTTLAPLGEPRVTLTTGAPGLSARLSGPRGEILL